MPPDSARPYSAGSRSLTSFSRPSSALSNKARPYAIRLGEKRTPARPGSSCRRAKVKFSSEVAPHRRPGICAAILGFLIVFTGIMMLGVSSSAKHQTKQILVTGPICLSVGCIIVIIGFTYQFIVHRRYKNSLEKDDEVPTSSRGSSRISLSEDEQVYHIDTSKSPGRGSTIIIDNKAYSPSIEVIPAQCTEETAV